MSKLATTDPMPQFEDGLALVGDGGLGIQVLEFTGRDLTFRNERIDLALLQADNTPKPVRRQLAFIDEPIERPRRKTKRRCGFFGRQPVSVSRGHAQHYISLPLNTLSTPLNTFQFCVGGCP